MRFIAAFLLLFVFVSLHVAAVARSRMDNAAFPPFRIAGNLYYVGSEDLAAYLITTPQGDILINSNLESSPRADSSRVSRRSAFKFSDIKILLISHGHFDHCAGSAADQEDDRRAILT